MHDDCLFGCSTLQLQAVKVWWLQRAEITLTIEDEDEEVRHLRNECFFRARTPCQPSCASAAASAALPAEVLTCCAQAREMWIDYLESPKRPYFTRLTSGSGAGYFSMLMQDEKRAEGIVGIVG